MCEGAEWILITLTDMNERSGCSWLSEWMGGGMCVFCISCDRALLFVRFLPAGTRLKGGIDPCVLWPTGAHYSPLPRRILGYGWITARVQEPPAAARFQSRGSGRDCLLMQEVRRYSDFTTVIWSRVFKTHINVVKSL